MPNNSVNKVGSYRLPPSIIYSGQRETFQFQLTKRVIRQIQAGDIPKEEDLNSLLSTTFSQQRLGELGVLEKIVAVGARITPFEFFQLQSHLKQAVALSLPEWLKETTKNIPIEDLLQSFAHEVRQNNFFVSEELPSIKTFNGVGLTLQAAGKKGGNTDGVGVCCSDKAGNKLFLKVYKIFNPNDPIQSIVFWQESLSGIFSSLYGPFPDLFRFGSAHFLSGLTTAEWLPMNVSSEKRREAYQENSDFVLLDFGPSKERQTFSNECSIAPGGHADSCDGNKVGVENNEVRFDMGGKVFRPGIRNYSTLEEFEQYFLGSPDSRVTRNPLPELQSLRRNHGLTEVQIAQAFRLCLEGALNGKDLEMTKDFFKGTGVSEMNDKGTLGDRKSIDFMVFCFYKLLSLEERSQIIINARLEESQELLNLIQEKLLSWSDVKANLIQKISPLVQEETELLNQAE